MIPKAVCLNPPFSLFVWTFCNELYHLIVLFSNQFISEAKWCQINWQTQDHILRDDSPWGYFFWLWLPFLSQSKIFKNYKKISGGSSEQGLHASGEMNFFEENAYEIWRVQKHKGLFEGKIPSCSHQVWDLSHKSSLRWALRASRRGLS
jgi:hypothetical protein